jgi:hypothetical protein
MNRIYRMLPSSIDIRAVSRLPTSAFLLLTFSGLAAINMKKPALAPARIQSTCLESFALHFPTFPHPRSSIIGLTPPPSVPSLKLSITWIRPHCPDRLNVKCQGLTPLSLFGEAGC